MINTEKYINNKVELRKRTEDMIDGIQDGKETLVGDRSSHSC